MSIYALYAYIDIFYLGICYCLRKLITLFGKLYRWVFVSDDGDKYVLKHASKFHAMPCYITLKETPMSEYIVVKQFFPQFHRIEVKEQFN